jgi:hypothetical protein
LEEKEVKIKEYTYQVCRFSCNTILI